MTRKVGRPVSFKPEMLDKIEPLMAQGASIFEVSGEIGISKDTLYRWCDENDSCYNKEFSDAIKRGKELSRMWWERQGRINLENKDFSPTLWYMNMRNRFNWSDKQEISHSLDKSFLDVLKEANEE